MEQSIRLILHTIIKEILKERKKNNGRKAEKRRSKGTRNQTEKSFIHCPDTGRLCGRNRRKLVCKGQNRGCGEKTGRRKDRHQPVQCRQPDGRQLDASGARILFAPVEALPMASSVLRTRLAAGEECENELPASVRRVIRREGLYTKGDEVTNESETGKRACAQPTE